MVTKNSSNANMYFSLKFSISPISQESSVTTESHLLGGGVQNPIYNKVNMRHTKYNNKFDLPKVKLLA